MSEDKKTREYGYYWIKFNADSQWKIAEWMRADEWHFGGYFFSDHEITEIDETRIMREEEKLKSYMEAQKASRTELTQFC